MRTNQMSEVELAERGRNYYGLIKGELPVTPYPYSLNELELLAVVMEIRRSCYVHCDFEDSTDRYHTLNHFDDLAHNLGIISMATREPPLWYQDSPSRDLFEFMRTVHAQNPEHANHELVWFYKDPSVGAMIEQAANERLDSGVVLGYPDCCVRWHQQMRMKEVERWKERKVRSFGRNRKRIHKTADTAFSPKEALHNAELTRIRFPFVSHVACDKCLSEENSLTAELNTALASLAMAIDKVALYEPVLTRAKEARRMRRASEVK